MVRVYLDEDVDILAAKILGSRNVTVTSAQEQGVLGKSDREQLNYASLHGYAIVSHNRKDFERLFAELTAEGKQFPGIIIMKHKKVHQVAADLARFCLTHGDINKQFWYL